MPHLSVVLPVYNAARSIRPAVDSILRQTLEDLELIVVDDGSSDETCAIVREIHDARLRLLACSHRGVAETANAGLDVATAAFVARMDADDISHPARLEKQLAYACAHDLDVVGCQVRIIDDTGERSPSMQRYARWINEETKTAAQIMALRFVEFPLVNPTLLARRAYFELKYRRGDFPEDYDLMLRAAEWGMQFGKVDELLFDWTDGPARLTRTDACYSPAAFDRCRRAYLRSGPLQQVDCVDVWGAGQTGKPWIRWLQSQGIQIRHGYDVSARKINARIHGVEIISPAALPVADGTPLLIAVGAAGARELIEPHLCEREYRPGVDAWFVA